MNFPFRKSVNLISKALIKLICFVMLFCRILIITNDYLEFPTNVKLEIINNKNQLPAITICISKEEDYLNLDKILSHYNISDEYEQLEKYYIQNIHNENQTLKYEKFYKFYNFKNYYLKKLKKDLNVKDILDFTL